MRLRLLFFAEQRFRFLVEQSCGQIVTPPECATLKAQLSERDRELAAAKAGGSASVGGSTQVAAAAAHVSQAAPTGREPGYLELLGWTVNP